MIFYLTGSSGSGKSTIAHTLAVDRLEIHDSDEDGVPDGADAAWRQRNTERWLQAAADLHDRDLLLTGQSPLGEVLAAPSAPLPDAIAVALIEVGDRERFVRLERRDPDTWSRDDKRRFVSWGRWHTAHAADPHHAAEVLSDNGWSAMRWDRWSHWTPDDPRWRTDVFDTTDRSIEDSAADISTWIAAVRSDPQWPLRRGWDRL